MPLGCWGFRSWGGVLLIMRSSLSLVTGAGAQHALRSEEAGWSGLAAAAKEQR
jgi:hypothetical protein